jgi:hypothetical protein
MILVKEYYTLQRYNMDVCVMLHVIKKQFYSSETLDYMA